MLLTKVLMCMEANVQGLAFSLQVSVLYLRSVEEEGDRDQGINSEEQRSAYLGSGIQLCLPAIPYHISRHCSVGFTLSPLFDPREPGDLGQSQHFCKEFWN